MQNNSSMYDLTKRELDVLRLMTQSLSNQDISDKLNVSIETVRTHAKRIYSKLGVSGRQEASFRAIELGIVKNRAVDTERVTIPIPIAMDTFIGREEELAEFATIFEGGDRLITILGSGGMGKTRLALEYARQHVGDYSDGVYFIPLETVSSVENIVLQIIDCLPLKISRENTPQQQLMKYLADKQMLLVIDNWEHLLEGALLITEILRNTHQVHIIATSRDRLRLRKEVVYRLEGLSIPKWDTIQVALEYDAVKFLKLIARRVNPEWNVTDDNLQAIHDLCVLTQGMPLGIILSAGWLDIYPLERIVEEIQNNVDFLETQLRDIPERHRSIRAVFEWTWGLLSQAERDVFTKLSVFRNGCTLAAAEEVAGASPRIMQALINKALVHRDAYGRFVLHELLRQYGENQLRDVPDIERQIRNLHADFYIRLLEGIVTSNYPARDGELELENLYVAWYWIVDTRNTGLLWRSINSYALMTYQFGAFSEMKIIFDYAIANLDQLDNDDPYLLASLVIVTASVDAYLLDWDAVKRYREQGLSLLEGINWETAPLDVIFAHYHLALCSRNIDHAYAVSLIEHLQQVLESRDLSSHPTGLTMLAYVYSQLAILYDYSNQRAYAKELAYRALKFAREIQLIPVIALSTELIGWVEFINQNYDVASKYMEESEQMYRQLISTFDFGKLLCEAGTVAIVQQQYDKARRYLRESLSILADYGLLHMVIQLICTVADWMQAEGYALEATELVAFCQQHTTMARYTELIENIMNTLIKKLPAEDFQQAVQRGQTLDYETVIREVTVWLED